MHRSFVSNVVFEKVNTDWVENFRKCNYYVSSSLQVLHLHRNEYNSQFVFFVEMK